MSIRFRGNCSLIASRSRRTSQLAESRVRAASVHSQRSKLRSGRGSQEGPCWFWSGRRGLCTGQFQLTFAESLTLDQEASEFRGRGDQERNDFEAGVTMGSAIVAELDEGGRRSH